MTSPAIELIIASTPCSPLWCTVVPIADAARSLHDSASTDHMLGLHARRGLLLPFQRAL